jgi:hypothetical protein
LDPYTHHATFVERKVTTKELESLREPNPNCQNQERIDDKRTSLQLALLLHFKFGSLAAVQRFLGGQHTAAHQDPNKILPQVQGLVSEKVFSDVERIMHFGAPAQFKKNTVVVSNFSNIAIMATTSPSRRTMRHSTEP